MAEGWISVHRTLQGHWLWSEKPFSKGQAWIDMLMMANHADNKFLLGNELVEVKAGSFITSEVKLMEKWGWGKTKTRAFLDLLQKDGMITKKTDRKKTTIIIENYSDYQEKQTTDRPPADHEQTASRLPADTNNNDNNDNNENKYINYTEIKDAYNRICASLPAVKKLSESRKKAIKARLATYTEADLIEAFKKTAASDFLKGKNQRNWQADFDWILNDTNLAKILDGKYDNKGKSTPATNQDMTDLDDLFN